MLALLYAVAETVDVVVDDSGYSEQDDTERTDGQGGARRTVAAETVDGMLGGLDVHGLDDEQVVVERDDRVHQGDEYEQVEPGVEGGHEDEELREESGKRGNTGQGEEAERHEEGQLRVGAVQAVVVVDVDFPAVLLDDVDDGKGTEVGDHVDQQVEDERGHALCRSAHDGQYEVAGLADGGEGHEALEVLLPDGEEVGDGDGGDDDPEETDAPHAEERFRAEDLHEDGHEHKGCRALGNHAEVTGHDGGCALVGVGGPQVEGDKRDFEAHARDEQHEGEDAQGGLPSCRQCRRSRACLPHRRRAICRRATGRRRRGPAG